MQAWLLRGYQQKQALCAHLIAPYAADDGLAGAAPGASQQVPVQQWRPRGWCNSGVRSCSLVCVCAVAAPQLLLLAGGLLLCCHCCASLAALVCSRFVNAPQGRGGTPCTPCQTAMTTCINSRLFALVVQEFTSHQGIVSGSWPQGICTTLDNLHQGIWLRAFAPHQGIGVTPGMHMLQLRCLPSNISDT
eukprot:1159275-Pelagomonas_calceolata.AAC.2